MSDYDEFMYVRMIIVREFEAAPIESDWYSDPHCDAASCGIFREEIVEVQKVRRLAYSRPHHLELIRRQVADMCERLYPGNTRSVVRLTDRGEYEKYQANLTTFEQEMKEVVR